MITSHIIELLMACTALSVASDPPQAESISFTYISLRQHNTNMVTIMFRPIDDTDSGTSIHSKDITAETDTCSANYSSDSAAVTKYSRGYVYYMDLCFEIVQYQPVHLILQERIH